MPVEIRELIVQASLRPDEDTTPSPSFTEEDEARLMDRVFERVHSEGAISPKERRELIAEMKREVRSMLEEHWRK